MSLVPNSSFEREYFGRYYRDYRLQNSAKKMRFYRTLAERAVEGIQQPRILELGCGLGAFLSILDHRWRKFGLDISHFAIDQSSQAIADVTLSVSDAAEIPFDEYFDLIVAFDVMEHIGDLEKVVHTVISKLTPVGSFVFAVPVYDGPTGPVIRFFDKDPTHLHKRSRNFWLNWARHYFQVVDWWGVYRYLLPGGYYLHKPTRIFRRSAPAIAVFARREKIG
jgi:SAM-dependent methyltransferase